MRIVIADDQPEVCSAMRLVLDQELKKPAEISEAHDAVALFSRMQSACVDLILLDWELPGLQQSNREYDPAQAKRLIAAIRELCPETRILALSSRPDSRQNACQAGVDAFMSKVEPAETLLKMIYLTLDGKVCTR